jgi:hypothetical protein
MLFLVVAWIALLALSLPIGAAILRWAAGAGVFGRGGDRLILSLWLGVFVLADSLLAASFVFPLSARFGAVLGLGLAVAAVSWRPVREEIYRFRARLEARLVLGFLALVSGVAVFTAQTVVYIDTGFYHAGAIRWLSQYGAVHGIGLVQDQLGFASSWFALAAPFNPHSLRDHGMAITSGLVLLLLALHWVICMSRVLRHNARRSDWLVIIASPLLIVLLPSSQVLVSASPDLPVNVLVVMVGWSIFSLADVPRGAASAASRLTPGPASVPLLLALGSLTVKPQAGPLVVVAALFYIATGHFRVRRAAWAATLGIAVLMPWLAYEFITTGCPAYPLPICADVAWSVGTEAAGSTAEGVRGLRAAGDDLGGGWWLETWLTESLSPMLGILAGCSILALGGGLLGQSQRWLAAPARRAASFVAIAGALGLLWFLLNAEEILIVALACVSLIPLAVRQRGTGWLLALGLAGIAFTIYASPFQLRFAIGYVAILLARLAVFQGPRLWIRLRPQLAFRSRSAKVRPATLLVAVALASALGPVLRPTTEGRTELDRLGWLIPPERPTAVRVEARNGIPYRVPRTPIGGPGTQPLSKRSGLCWAAELPCTGQPVVVDMALRDVVLRDPDQGIAGGFERSAGER